AGWLCGTSVRTLLMSVDDHTPPASATRTGPLCDAATAVTAVVRFAWLYESSFSPSTLTVRTTGPVPSVTTTSWSCRSQSPRLTPETVGWRSWTCLIDTEPWSSTTDPTSRCPPAATATRTPSMDSRRSVIGPYWASSLASTGAATQLLGVFTIRST